MNDTPQNIKDLQLQIWLSKSPGERLKQFMEDSLIVSVLDCRSKSKRLSKGGGCSQKCQKREIELINPFN